MKKNQEIAQIFGLLERNHLGRAVEHLSSFGCAYPELGVEDALAEIESDYRRMADYWQAGYKDPERDRVFGQMVQRLYRLVADTWLRYTVTHDAFYSRFHKRVRVAGRDWSLARLQEQMEAFVADVAMLQLETPARQDAQRKRIYAAHQQFRIDLFDYVWTSRQWPGGTGDAFAKMLLTPTIDTVDQQVLVSAITLSAMNVFDLCKLETLMEVSLKSCDEHVRQRALVGWVLVLIQGSGRVFPQLDTLLDRALDDPRMPRELYEFQLQLLFCATTEQDNRTIQREIMPELLKNSPFVKNPDGSLSDKEDDFLQDILNPHEEEQSMERIEEGYRRMMEMQKAGTDIYFSGFAQMKRFPFFDQPCNWLMPFFRENPALEEVAKGDGKMEFMWKLLNSGPFCDSDKYSLALAFRQMADRMPESARKMLNDGQLAAISIPENGGQNSPADIRRSYLQSLYRFMMVCPNRSEFVNPFTAAAPHDGNGLPYYLFFAHAQFCRKRLQRYVDGVVSFLIKRKMYREAYYTLYNDREHKGTYAFQMMMGYVLMHLDEGAVADGFMGMEASDCFRSALSFAPDDEKALVGLGKSLMKEGNDMEASKTYALLLERHPESKRFRMAHAVCLMRLMDYRAAVDELYRLYYENPEHADVVSELAWGLVNIGKYEQALGLFARLSENGTMKDADTVHKALCLWAMNRPDAAAVLFAGFLVKGFPKQGVDDYRRLFDENVVNACLPFLTGIGMGSVDIELMTELVAGKVVQRMR